MSLHESTAHAYSASMVGYYSTDGVHVSHVAHKRFHTLPSRGVTKCSYLVFTQMWCHTCALKSSHLVSPHVTTTCQAMLAGNGLHNAPIRDVPTARALRPDLLPPAGTHTQPRHLRDGRPSSASRFPHDATEPTSRRDGLERGEGGADAKRASRPLHVRSLFGVAGGARGRREGGKEGVGRMEGGRSQG